MSQSVLARNASFAEARGVKREIVADLQASWAAGKPIPPEDLLARWPVEPVGDADVAGLLFEDFCQRFRHDDSVSIEDYQKRFPEHENSLATLVRQQDFLAAVGAVNAGKSGSSISSLKLPAIDDEVFGFRLTSELGHGAFARVFLAEQVDLAERPVVLKVSGIVGDEPRTLARLQHTHIVPIYSLHDDAHAGLRAVCMPYFGGTTLARVLRVLWAKDKPPTQGRQLVEVLVAAACGLAPNRERPEASRPEATPLTVLGGLSYVRAAAWIAARLAEGLQHAHERGVFHRDIKPSNILLSDDGQPMLLDFNLAHNVHDTRAQATVGGTVAYMAPEHLRALASPDPGLGRQVDQRSDIYSLGMVLHEMLVGRGPFNQDASYAPIREVIEAMATERARGLPSGRRLARSIPWGLESIVRKCLAPDPTRRYQRAEDLADDLRRFLDDRPLRHAPELSWTERLAKWKRRHPRLTSSGSVAVVALALLVAVGAAFFGIRENLAAAQARQRMHDFETGTIRTLSLLNDSPELRSYIGAGLPVCVETLRHYQIQDRDDWQKQPEWLRLDPADRARLAEDARELLMLLALFQVQAAPRDEAVARQALSLLHRAEAIDGLQPSPALWSHRAHYHELLNETQQAARARERAAQAPPASPRDHLELARVYYRQQPPDYRRAVQELNRSLDLNPRYYWSLFLRSICRQELGEYTLAAADLGVCIGLRPEIAVGYYQRGSVLDHTGKSAEAIRDYSAALERDPKLHAAYLNRGMARYHAKNYALALDDFQKAKEVGRDDAAVAGGIGMAYEGLVRFPEADAAFREAMKQSAVDEKLFASVRLAYGFAVYRRLPDQAQEAFASVLKKDPSNADALYGQAMLLVEKVQPGNKSVPKSKTWAKDIDQAVDYLTGALESKPAFPNARRFRAVLAARRGQWQKAFLDIDLCQTSEPANGATLYAAACVAALSAAQAADPKPATDRALQFLKLAFQHNYGRDQAATDADLASIRHHPEMQRLLKKQ